MKILNKKQIIAIFVVLLLLAVVGLTSDTLIASLIYVPDDTVESIFYKIMPAVPIAACSFSAALLVTCRNTKASRNKNRAMNIFYTVLSFVFAFAAAYYPFAGIRGNGLFGVIAAALLIAFSSIMVGSSFFKETYQKEIMTGFAKRVIFSTLAVAAICAVTLLIPQRLCYDAVRLNILQTGTPDGPFGTKAPLIPFATASAPIMTYLVMLKDSVPKLRFSERLLFVISAIWTLTLIVGALVSGRIFLSNAAFGALVGYSAVIFFDKITN